MNLKLKKILFRSSLTLMLANSAVYANEFSFDRPGTGFSTGIAPQKSLVWEQSLANVRYNDQRINGDKSSNLDINSDILLRTGLTSTTELQLGWQGPSWRQHKYLGKTTENDGVGDVFFGLKKAIAMSDPKYTWAVMAAATLATGDEDFSVDEDIYSLGSSVSYEFSEDITTGMNMQYDYQDNNFAWLASPNIEYALSPKLSAFSEYVYYKKEHLKSEQSLGSGLIWRPSDKMQFDASIGYGLTDDADRLKGNLGFSVLFN